MWGRCSLQQPSLPLKVMCHQWSSAIEKLLIHSPSTSHVLCSICQGPWKTIIQAMLHCFPLSVSFTHICLCVFLSCSPSFFHLVSRLIVFVFFCPCHCFALTTFCFPSRRSCSPRLAFSSYISLLLIPVFHSLPVSSPASSPPHGKNAQSHSLKSQPNLHYPTPSFYPLITHSTPLT